MALGQSSSIVDLKLEFIDSEGNTIGNEHSVADLILPNGARILSYTPIPIGEFLIIKTIDGRFESPAIVKSIQIGSDNIPRLTVEFMGTSWQHKWIFIEPSTTKPKRDEELLAQTQDTRMLLQIVINDLESKLPLDSLFLSELKTSVDALRTLLFSRK